MKTILIATHNLHKKEEIQQILGTEYSIKSLSDFDLHEEIIEDGDSFHANAQIKAQYCYEKTGLQSIGDDSGLVVEELGGRPGIFSARYAGNHDFEKNITKVLEEMKGIENRKAYFVTVLCLFDETGPHFFEGKVHGNLLVENKGQKGFGYDPIFVPEGYSNSFAEMLPEEKNKISHRKKAFDQLMKKENTETNLS